MSSDAAQGHSDEQKFALVERILRGEISADEACREHGCSESELTRWVSAHRARRAQEEQLSAALSAPALPRDDAPISEFTGNLESLTLAQLIQQIEHGRKDVQIRVDHDGQQSHIWCEQGQLVDARSGPLAGTAALYRLFSLRHGRVYARFVRSERTRTIHASTAALLEEAAQRHDECRELRERIGDTDAVYVASPQARRAQARLAPETWQMLRAFDGVSSVERVIATRNTPELESLTEIAGLLEQGLLMPRPAPSSPQRLPLGFEQTERAPREPDSDAPPESSFRPFAASLRARFTRTGPGRRRLWLSSSLAGAGLVTLAFAVGFWSVRRERASQRPAQPALASANDWTNAAAAGRCPDGLVRIAGGPLFAPLNAPAPAADGAREPRIPPFCLGRTEVTVAEFEACVEARACAAAEREIDRRPTPAELPNRAMDDRAPDPRTAQCNSGQAGRETHPINCVNLDQAEHYCAWRGGRLPSQTEWEYAAAEATPDPRERHPGTLPVGSFPAGANPQGVLDLLGNVSEWTTGSVGLRQAQTDDGAHFQLYAVLGGGQPGASRLGSLASRQYLNPSARGRNIGFRCALDPRAATDTDPLPPK
ncbi:MAG TPA: SUMF1/EgtB/PvdO family nonheme iron enzyme [Polyangiaceae bacterium]|jgi:formylglycine-generating enzyme required for sulfatase activity/transposase-like protein|nr:SUMF1/EgtB/PvdO family nonheme iron enzyme [Polyangiaceae bacterium]